MLLAALIDPPDAPTLPGWDSLPPIILRQPRQVTPAATEFVATEVAEGRCVLSPSEQRHVRVDVALLIARSGRVLASVPHAIDCPTVEQFAAGLAIGWVRGNLHPRLGRMGWYRLRLDFDWTQ